ncbi:hypothetical protein [Oceanospirillum sanctuarii]|uniref:hypothetical protein n=1 Tax=Oceanospirillum sanctuarii TaxID=1434821 RepID=UPI000A37DF97|nr:hypothetical protein [Oceanospirillum sanctuarii]
MPRKQPKLILIISLALLSACGSESSDDGSQTSSNSASSKAYFIDSGVGGLDYKSASFSGKTDKTGAFKYSAGESTTFSYQGIQLGSVKPSDSQSFFTPLNLFNTEDVNNQAVKNTLVLLQTMDSDQNPSNGITLREDQFDGLSTLDLTSTDFQSSLDQTLPNSISLISETDALAHFEETLSLLKATPAVSGSWYMRDTKNGDLSAIYTFSDTGSLQITEFDNCPGSYWASSESSAKQNCSTSDLTLSWSISERKLQMNNSSVKDVCHLIAVSPFTIEANCNFSGSGLGDELIRFERKFSILSSPLIATSYREVESGSLSFSLLTLKQDLTGNYVYYNDSGVAQTGAGDQGSFNWSLSGAQISYTGTDNSSSSFSGTYTFESQLKGALKTTANADGTTSKVTLLPDFDSDLAKNFIQQTVYGIYDADSGLCKHIYVIDGTKLRKESSASGSTICQYQSPITLPQTGEEGLFIFNNQNGAFLLEQNSTREVCWPISFASLSDNNGYLTLSCSTNSSDSFNFQIWRPL